MMGTLSTELGVMVGEPNYALAANVGACEHLTREASSVWSSQINRGGPRTILAAIGDSSVGTPLTIEQAEALADDLRDMAVRARRAIPHPNLHLLVWEIGGCLHGPEVVFEQRDVEAKIEAFYADYADDEEGYAHLMVTTINRETGADSSVTYPNRRG